MGEGDGRGGRGSHLETHGLSQQYAHDTARTFGSQKWSLPPGEKLSVPFG